MEVLGLNSYHTPQQCSKCGGKMIFKGVGEYHCEKCGEVAYDDYGTVRLYVEKHKGARMTEIEEATGVKQRTIRMMLKESRFEVCADSKTFLRCEICGSTIRSGRLCLECAQLMRQEEKERNRQERIRNMQGFGKEVQEEKGEKRFRREQW